jgi:methylaspartate mutase epsilon subunit
LNAPSSAEATRRPLSEERIPDDVFAQMRRENLARWSTGNGVDFDEAVALQLALPEHKQLGRVMRRAVAERRCLTQPRGGFGTFEMQRELMVTLDRDGHADIVPTTTDSYTLKKASKSPSAWGARCSTGTRWSTTGWRARAS